MKETILSNYTGDFAEKDSTGQHSRAAVTFHPVLSKSSQTVETARERRQGTRNACSSPPLRIYFTDGASGLALSVCSGWYYWQHHNHVWQSLGFSCWRSDRFSKRWLRIRGVTRRLLPVAGQPSF